MAMNFGSQNSFFEESKKMGIGSWETGGGDSLNLCSANYLKLFK